ncbi:MAG TPA: glycine cleavage system protein GcvH [Planctomycetota bacterium]|nr:glycine cleavage system protein GcvH [Planctomycetota bacterium]
MGFPQNLKYSETHEWARLDGAEVVVGITDFAVHQLQDLVFIDLPKPGAKCEKGKRFGEIESVKAVSDLVAPVSGEVTAVNDSLLKSLDPLTADAYSAWMIKVKPSAADPLAGMLDAAAYEKVTAEGGHH